ncbi:DUF447 domain-containing protein [Stieleria varia]|uniref:DUF447 family protein n=1 Tax=Stieleria varia TaxID=2528005 RepID=A0A5C6B7K8_9BACT|nr:DUF447 domain-containing protein [Stieleria varia]TWU07938.1 hypothetical protein Pla52n_05150 [Stieleria varia]
MILESIVTTVDSDGRVNIAPMGPTVQEMHTDRPQFLLRPFAGSRTYDNLMATHRATIHVTDDALLFAHTAVGDVPDPEQRVRSVDDGRWRILKDCHRWFCVQTEVVQEDDLRMHLACRVIDSGIQRPFFGFNRAKHAVIEAAILATRTHLLAAAEIRDTLLRLQPLIDKTAGPEEHQAFEFLKQTIDERIENLHQNNR